MQTAFIIRKRVSILRVCSLLLVFISCRRETPSTINAITEAGARLDNPDPTLPSGYPLQYRGLLDLSVPRGDLSATACGEYIFFGGGRTVMSDGTSAFHTTVDIFNVNDRSRTTAQLSQARYWLTAGSLGDKVFFAGGMSPSGHSNRVDIYDTRTRTWGIAHLSQPRYLIAVASRRGQIVFAGGITYNSQLSNVVDIYDANTNSWSVTTMKDIEGIMTGASGGTTTLFAGGDHDGNGIVTKTVVFHPDPTLQTVNTLAGHHTDYLSAVSIGNKIMFAGGYNYPLSPKVSVYDAQSKSWSDQELSQARLGIGTFSLDRFAVFAGGSLADAGVSDRLDAYDNSNGKWYSMKLKYKWWPLAAAGAGNTALIACNASYNPPGQIMVYTIAKPSQQ